jgi:hypothetical protein
MKRQTIKSLIIILLLLPLAALLIPADHFHYRVSERVNVVFDWLAPAIAGVTFTTLGLLKVFGWTRGIVGGGGKPASCRLFGRCPTWSKQFNIVVIALFLGIGILNLGICLAALLKQ